MPDNGLTIAGIAQSAASADDNRVGAATRAAVAIAAAGIASAAYQRAADAADRRRFPAPGRLVDIGGRRIHLLAMGEGSPAVVIIPALGANVLEWVRVLRSALSETTVCAYDRAGLGWSDPSHGPVSFDAMADDVHALLKADGIEPPYVIAGHSMGGVVARRFQSRYPEDVAGMLLIDSSHEDQARRLGDNDRWHDIGRAAKRRLRVLGVRRAAARFGLVRSLDAESLVWETVPEYAGAAKASSLSTKQRRTVVGEMLLLVRFFCTAVEAQAQDMVSRIEELLAVREEMLGIVRAHRLRGTSVSIVDDLIGYSSITPSAAARLHNVTYKAANDAIRKLEGLGVLQEITGASYGRIFVCPQVRNIVLRP
jgi:pimeloyl-ACP methyl ester carboxylesterase